MYELEKDVEKTIWLTVDGIAIETFRGSIDNRITVNLSFLT